MPPEPLNSAMVENSHRLRMAGEKMPPPAKASPALAAVILKACAFAPGDRYRSALDMKRDLERCLPERRPDSVPTARLAAIREPAPEATRVVPMAPLKPDEESLTKKKARMGGIFTAAGDL